MKEDDPIKNNSNNLFISGSCKEKEESEFSSVQIFD